MKNVHLIPTEKASRLFYYNNHLGLARNFVKKNDGVNPQHAYITSEKEDFNENDYVITKDGRLVQVSYLLSKDLDGAFKVVIASDPDLIADGIQSIDYEFLEWFVKNPSCEWVEVKSKMNHPRAVFGYEIIVQKEEIKVFSESGSQLFFDEKGRLIKEEPKQEIIATEEDAKIFVDTLENPPAPNEKLKIAFEKQLNQETLEEDLLDTVIQIVGDSDCTTIKEFFVKHNWQQEQDKNKYSEEEVENIAKDAYTMGRNNILIGVFNKWFEQLKK